MKKINPFLLGIYCILTLGIYFLYWAFSLQKSLKAKGYKTFPFIFFGVPYLLFFIGLYYIFGVAIFQGTQDDIGLVLVLFIFYLYIFLLALLLTFGLAWQLRISRVLGEETGGIIGLKSNLLWFYLANLLVAIFIPALVVWPMFVQHKLNHYLSSPTIGVSNGGG